MPMQEKSAAINTATPACRGRDGVSWRAGADANKKSRPQLIGARAAIQVFQPRQLDGAYESLGQAGRERKKIHLRISADGATLTPGFSCTNAERGAR
jgi:hypothetical protein